MCHAYNENQEKTNNERNKTAEPGKKVRTLGEKENLKYLRILEGDTIKQVVMK